MATIPTPPHSVAVDWKQAPRSARWWAMDEDGAAHWFLMPDVAAFTNFWYAERVPAPPFGFSGDWRHSMVERPPRAGGAVGHPPPFTPR